MPDTYRGWSIYYDPPPIPWRGADWRAISPNYDASWEGEEDGWVDNGESVSAATREQLIEEIDAWFAEREAVEIIKEMTAGDEPLPECSFGFVAVSTPLVRRARAFIEKHNG